MENSFRWTTTSGTPTGDQQASYSQADDADILRVLAACSGFEGVAPGYLNELECTDGGTNTVDVDTGGAVVDGKVYVNDAVQNINIPSAVGAGNTRIDRLVLRADWTNFNVSVYRIAGTDAGTPTAPAITQTSEDVYDIKLCQVLVDTSGNVNVTDERDWAVPQVDGETIEITNGALNVKNSGITSTKIDIGAVTETKIDTGAVTETKIDTGAVTSIKIGTGAVTETKIDTGAVTETKIGTGAVTEIKIGTGAVTSTKIGTGAVTSTKIGTGAVTPTKASFFSDTAIYSGKIQTADSLVIKLPSGWSYSKLGTGHHRVTHNLGTANYVVVISTGEIEARSTILGEATENSFTFRTFNSSGVATDTFYANFILIVYG